MKILITGGHGFIGSNLIKILLGKFNKEFEIINLDCNTYAARPQYLDEFREYENYEHVNVNIRDQESVLRVFNKYRPDSVVHLAAESHVCNSIKGPRLFYETNVMGTLNLLEGFLKLDNGGRFLHVSTDEVFGELPLDAPDQKFSELTPVAPRSPYSSSKAASDHIVQSYHYTYGMNTCITNCSNNYGPNQHHEKLIPKTIKHLLKGQPVIVHGKGDHVRDWIFVEDHCRGLLSTLMFGRTSGERYCLGGNCEKSNMEIIQSIHIAMQGILGKRIVMDLRSTNDRPTDDLRYAVDTYKAKNQLGWSPSPDFNGRLEETIKWYLGEFANEN